MGEITNPVDAIAEELVDQFTAGGTTREAAVVGAGSITSGGGGTSGSGS